jgi:hypothetical protein
MDGTHLKAGRTGLRRRATASVMLAAALGAVSAFAQAEPLLQRFRIATVTAQDLARVEQDYRRYLDYQVRERGRVSADLAQSWDAPRMAGRPYVLMSSDAAPDVYVRAVRSSATPQYRSLTTWGWNAIEIVVDDTDGTYRRFARGSSGTGSPFKIIGEPANLSGYPSIRAFQVEGRSREVLYLTSETGDRSQSPLPPPNGPIGRVFIMVVAGPDVDAMVEWYASTFNLVKNPVRQRPVGVLQRAQGLPPDRTLPLTTLRLAQQGNLLELDGYAEGDRTRPVRPGELPPGVAITSASVRDLDAINLDDNKAQFIVAPHVHAGLAYGGRRSATLRGAAGELVELIEE